MLKMFPRLQLEIYIVDSLLALQHFSCLSKRFKFSVSIFLESNSYSFFPSLLRYLCKSCFCVTFDFLNKYALFPLGRSCIHLQNICSHTHNHLAMNGSVYITKTKLLSCIEDVLSHLTEFCLEDWQEAESTVSKRI